MSPEEIREVNSSGQRVALEAKTGAQQDVCLRSLEISILSEIAAQLAELNLHLRKNSQ